MTKGKAGGCLLEGSARGASLQWRVKFWDCPSRAALLSSSNVGLDGRFGAGGGREKLSLGWGSAPCEVWKVVSSVVVGVDHVLGHAVYPQGTHRHGCLR